jgi:predicted nucleic acid-binding protein
MTVCVDASVLVKLVVPEPGSLAVHSWLESNQGRTLISPSSMPAEVTSALYQKARRGEMTSQQATEALGLMAGLGVQIRGDWGLMERALDLAVELGQPTAYDAVYLALAEREQSELVTADTAFARACRNKHPRVRALLSDDGQL